MSIRNPTTNKKEIPMGKCPKCDKEVRRLGIETIPAGRGDKFAGVTFLCPSCHCVLGAGLDPVAVMTDGVKEIVREIAKFLRRG